MANPQTLNFEAHRHLKVITSRGAEYGENIHIVPVVADELVNLVLDYPVCLTKDSETGQFGLSALLGFEQGENLFLDGDRWSASSIPLHVARQPFMVGWSSPPDAGGEPGNALISINVDSSRVQEEEGEALFNEDGSNTKFLDGVSQVLGQLLAGDTTTRDFVDVLVAHNLIEPAQLNITFANGEQTRYEGVYTVNDEKLRSLGGEVLTDMNAKGYLQTSNLLMVSLGHITKMVGWKNKRQAPKN